jgi:hypothetical protein
MPHDTPSANYSRIITIRSKKVSQSGMHSRSRAVAVVSRRKETLEGVETLYEGELRSSRKSGAQYLCFMDERWRIDEPDSSVNLVRKAHHHFHTLYGRRITRAWDFVCIANAQKEKARICPGGGHRK